MTQGNKNFNTQAIHYGYSPLDFSGGISALLFFKRLLLFFRRLNMAQIALQEGKKGIFIHGSQILL
ncbi:methionine gamma-lyase [Proteus vulgaris]|nr:methionine gamma-lyase [Proteus vulgaris]